MQSAVRSLASTLTPVFRRIQDADERVIEDQIAIARVAAPTGEETARAEWMVRRLRTAGLRNADIDAAGNVIAWHRSHAAAFPLVLCAHLDTVFESREPVHVQREGARLHAPGISDNARGLAALAALADLVGSGSLAVSRPILFAADRRGGHGTFGLPYLFV
jgi:acetylornithine deacetylase/succinyl-diaminopimelate desuccinylase-like protein